MRLVADARRSDTDSGREAVKVVSQEGRRSSSGAKRVVWAVESAAGGWGLLKAVQRLLEAA